MVIWANHLLRSSIGAMQETARRLRADDSLLAVEPQVAPLHEVFRLQGDAELAEAERRYLPARESLSAVILAAGEGTDFGGLTARVPKAMLRVQGRPILARLLDDFAAFGGRNAVVVRGHRAEAIDVPGARFVDNADFASTSEAYSLSLAESDLGPSTLVAFGDIVLKRHLIQALLEEAGDGITLAVDSALAGTSTGQREMGRELPPLRLEPGRHALLFDLAGQLARFLDTRSRAQPDDARHGPCALVL